MSEPTQQLLSFNPFSETSSEDFIGRYFVGRENYLRMFHQRLQGLEAHIPNHFYVAGVHGTGKTSYLVKLKEIAFSENFLCVIPTPEIDSDAPAQMNTILGAIVRGLQERIDKSGGKCTLLNTWLQGANQMLFICPRSTELQTDAVLQDLKTLSKYTADADVRAIVICIDEGQRLRAKVLSALKNTLQHLNTFLVVLSLRLDIATDDPVQAGRVMLDQMAQQAEKDFGASRFYVNGISMGPFDTEVEASECIRKRLEGNAIQFAEPVIDRLVRITGRIPRGLIQESSNLYELALKNNVVHVDLPLFQESFRTAHRPDVVDAANLCDEISGAALIALRGLLNFSVGAKPDTIAAYLYPSATPDTLSYCSTGIKLELDRISQKAGFVSVSNDVYAVPDPVRAYALKLALGMEQR